MNRRQGVNSFKLPYACNDIPLHLHRFPVASYLPFPLSPGFRPPFAIPCPDPSLRLVYPSIHPSIRFATPSPPFSTTLPTYLSYPTLCRPTHTTPVSQYVDSPPLPSLLCLSFSRLFFSQLNISIQPPSILSQSPSHTQSITSPAQPRHGKGGGSTSTVRTQSTCFWRESCAMQI